jgi:hypothetical protein
MRSSPSRRLAAIGSAAVLTGAGLAAGLAASPAGAAPPRITVVVSGLNNPRGLALVHDDVLLIAEAGRGGTVATIHDPEGGALGLGYTGSISAVVAPQTAHNQHPNRVVKGLLSGAAAADGPQGPKGSGATGPDGVATHTLRHMAIIETTFRPHVPAAARARDGRLLRARPYGSISSYANITGYEINHDPDGLGVDSDPYAVVNYRGGWLVADAAGNDLLWVDSSRHIHVFHVFGNVVSGPCSSQFDPKPPFKGCNFVPTSMAVDSHNNVYVGGLSGLTPHQAQLVELSPTGHRLHTWTGFTSITGVALGTHGEIFVSQLFHREAHPLAPPVQGVVTRIANGQRFNVDVPFPAGLAVDSSDNVYVSAFSILPSTGAGIPHVDTSGQVWRLHF